MKIRRIKKEITETIDRIARLTASLEKGSRLYEQKRNEVYIELASKNCLPIMETLKENTIYKIEYKESINLGTSKYPYNITVVSQFTGFFTRETDKYIYLKLTTDSSEFHIKKTNLLWIVL